MSAIIFYQLVISPTVIKITMSIVERSNGRIVGFMYI